MRVGGIVEMYIYTTSTAGVHEECTPDDTLLLQRMHKM